MDDLIRRQDAIYVINNSDAVYKGVYIHIEDATEELEKLPSAERAEWIPCSERLPSENGVVLVSLWNREIEIDRMFGGEWLINDGTDVLAWMPLPKPYIAERDCDHCTHHTEQGCTKWECEYERRTE